MEVLRQCAACISSIGSWWWRPKHSQRQKQQASCHILQLSPELILSISDFLSPASRALVSQTCHPLREILGDSASAAHLSYEQYLEYLTGLAHDMCDQWVCEVCPALHPIHRRDTPSSSYYSYSPCPRYYLERQDIAYGGRHRLDSRQLCIDHRHVQLALKYTRMRHPDYQEYLKKLLRPHYDANWRSHDALSDPPSVVQVYYKAQPRIATAADGTPRFLLKSSWRYIRLDQERMLTHDDMGHLTVCPHLKRSPQAIGHVNQELLEVLKTSFDRRTEEIRTACPLCRTDYSVRVSADAESVDLHVWQDLGPEGSPMDVGWNSQVYRHLFRDHDFGLKPCGVYCRTEPATIYHEPGSIRTLFGCSGEVEE